MLTYQHALAATGCDGRDGESTDDERLWRGRCSAGRRGVGGHHALLCMLQGDDRPPRCAATGGAECSGTTFVRHELARKICGVDPVWRRAGADDDGRRRSAEEEGEGRSPSGPLPTCWPATPNDIISKTKPHGGLEKENVTTRYKRDKSKTYKRYKSKTLQTLQK